MKRLAISNLLEGKCCCGGDSHTCEKEVDTLVFDRAASQFEALRLETEASGKRPKAFMLTISNLVCVRHVLNILVTSWLVPVMK